MENILTSFSPKSQLWLSSSSTGQPGERFVYLKICSPHWPSTRHNYIPDRLSDRPNTVNLFLTSNPFAFYVKIYSPDELFRLQAYFCFSCSCVCTTDRASEEAMVQTLCFGSEEGLDDVHFRFRVEWLLPGQWPFCMCPTHYRGKRLCNRGLHST